MFTQKRNIDSFIILVLLAGLLVGCAANEIASAAEEPAGGTITVVGRGQAFGQPDQAQAQVGVEIFAETVQQAANENEAIVQAIMKTLEAKGIAAKDVQTTNYSLWAEQRYGDSGPEGIVGYRVSNQVNITIRDFSRIGEVLAAVIDAGANNIFGLSFSVSDPAALEEEARAKAMSDAGDRAAKLAELGQVKLGEIKVISEVINQPPAPQPGFGGGVAEAEAAAPVPSISPGQLSFEVQVQITYSIK
jgi:uncharacterized protein YggE